jgi:hypothetical protein
VSAVTRLRIGERQTEVSVEAPAQVQRWQLTIGTLEVGDGPFRQRPPTPLELENAIAAVEDAVMPLARLLPAGTLLVSGDEGARRLRDAVPGAGDTLSLAQVEDLFDQLAAVALGRPAASAGVPTDAAFFAYALILREFMHHLGFEALTLRAA